MTNRVSINMVEVFSTCPGKMCSDQNATNISYLWYINVIVVIVYVPSCSHICI